MHYFKLKPNGLEPYHILTRLITRNMLWFNQNIRVGQYYFTFDLEITNTEKAK